MDRRTLLRFYRGLNSIAIERAEPAPGTTVGEITVSVADVLQRAGIEDDLETLTYCLASECVNHAFQISWEPGGVIVRPYQGLGEYSNAYRQSYRQPTLRQAVAHCLAALVHERDVVLVKGGPV